jgi:hypothetical protein
MTDQSTTPSRAVHQPLALGINIYSEAINAVTAVELGDTAVSLRFGDDRSAVTLFGEIEVVRQAIVEAAAHLGRLTEGEGR